MKLLSILSTAAALACHIDAAAIIPRGGNGSGAGAQQQEVAALAKRQFAPQPMPAGTSSTSSSTSSTRSSSTSSTRTSSSTSTTSTRTSSSTSSSTSTRTSSTSTSTRPSSTTTSTRPSSTTTTSTTSTRSSSTTTTTSSSRSSTSTGIGAMPSSISSTLSSITSRFTSSSTTSSSTSSANTAIPTGGPLACAHYMLITTPPNLDYTNDIQSAKAAGLDAFAVNYGGWNIDINVQNGYLDKIFQQAEALNFKLFLSVDLTSSSVQGRGMDADFIVGLYNRVYKSSAYLRIGGQPVLNSFQTGNPNFNWQNDVLNRLPTPAYFIPGSLSTDAGYLFNQNIGASGYFPWIHPYLSGQDEMNVDGGMAQQRSSTGKKWMAPLAPWFFKRFDGNTNWAHAQDGDMFIPRALNLLKQKPDMIQLVSWNDWGESSYFGPPDTTNQCPQCYWAKVDHAPALKVASSIIKAFKLGQTTIDTANVGENVYIYYRRQPNNVIGYSGDNGLGLPSNWESWQPKVFVVGMFDAPTTVTVTSGGQSYTLSFPAGLSQQSVQWQYGTQSVMASRNGNVIVNTKSGASIQGQLERYDGNVVWV